MWSPISSGIKPQCKHFYTHIYTYIYKYIYIYTFKVPLLECPLVGDKCWADKGTDRGKWTLIKRIDVEIIYTWNPIMNFSDYIKKILQYLGSQNCRLFIALISNNDAACFGFHFVLIMDWLDQIPCLRISSSDLTLALAISITQTGQIYGFKGQGDQLHTHTHLRIHVVDQFAPGVSLPIKSGEEERAGTDVELGKREQSPGQNGPDGDISPDFSALTSDLLLACFLEMDQERALWVLNSNQVRKFR